MMIPRQAFAGLLVMTKADFLSHLHSLENLWFETFIRLAIMAFI